ncbi:DUF433 domain-containing protein [Gaiella sp.]|jgi:uncharacterized protein (DUF433 family)|uniref:DUF433 domain-containing protein n=1 Tax=Gaiella sp. TaxID=2663207 RepID=UPI002E30A41F|nr:DUF433 domain-containing protein [Gaiella sp.]HEX5582452.1 DUF433 domain-containing protein [Gaiella sp.]
MSRGESKQGVSFRFNPRTVERLRRRSAEVGAPQAVLAERYIDEGMRIDEHPGIYFRDGGSGRRPSVLGTRLDVAQIVETLRQNENSIEETAEYLDISQAQVEAAVRYYAAYRDEVDRWIERSRTIAERERNLWRRQQEALAG